MILSRRIGSFSHYLTRMVSDESLEALARRSGFKKRESLITPRDFLETVFLENATGNVSLSQYCTAMMLNRGKGVSKQALDKRFKSGAKDFLRLIVEMIISQQFSASRKQSMGLFSEIRISDSSEFSVSPVLAEAFPGYGGPGREAMAQIQFEYELLEQKITRLSLGCALDSDVTEGLKGIDSIPPKALLLRDMGYFTLNVYQELIERDLFFISRLKPQPSIYIREQTEFKEISREALIDTLLAGDTKYLDLDVFIGSEKKIPVRLIANLLDEEQKSRRLKRKQLNKGKVSKQDELNSCINIFITNVDREECSPQKIYELYKLRWQVELIFKTWKSILAIHKVNPMNKERFECLMYVKFIWVLLNWSLVSLFSTISKTEISLHKFTHTLKKQVHRLVNYISIPNDQLTLWLCQLFHISLIYHQKEYKKGTLSVPEILNIKH